MSGLNSEVFVIVTLQTLFSIRKSYIVLSLPLVQTTFY